MKRSPLGLLLVASLTAACDVRVDEHGIQSMRVAEGRAEDVWTRSYTLPANGTFEIVGENGAIDVGAGSGPQVEVRAEREARADTEEAARELLQKLQIREEIAPDSVKLATVGGESSWAPPGLGRRAQTRVDYQVRVPRGLTLTFRSENGGVRLNDVNGRITATTTNGGITGEDLAGSLTAQTTNGGVRVDLVSIEGDVNLAATNGGIRLSMPPGTKATLEASVVNGGIDVDDEFGVASSAGPGPTQRISAAVNGGGPKVSATTVNGGVRIRARSANQRD
ncbi:MAG TPA: DUF4097 family beta strand repeat-containing protein [Vicinamibacterales bacterium]